MTAATGQSAVEWLLSSKEAAIRYLTRRDVLGEDDAEERARISDGAIVRALLRNQRGNPYKKWQGAHWRLVALADLELPAGEPRALAAAEQVLDWLTGVGHRRSVRVVNGLTRRCASQEGNALAACARLGLRDDPRVELLARSLVEWQWPDGGWNCDDRATRRSSFHESLAPTWGLHEYGADWSRAAARQAAELFLEHRLFRRLATGEPLHPSVVELHYPPYWHYDVLQALVVIWRLGLIRDARCADALDLLESKRRQDGRWSAARPWWRRPGSSGSNVEVVDWGRAEANEMVTLNALRVLTAAGRT